MKVKALKAERAFIPYNDKSLGIQCWGEDNDYPQKVAKISALSGTAVSCLDNYIKFINGQGFADLLFYKEIINRQNQTADYILDLVSNDYSVYGGFGLHINYNANYKVVEVQHIPFEHIRFERLDDDGNFSRVAIHWDWCREFSNLRRWRKEDIDFIDLYNPNPTAIQEQVDLVGGWRHYKGQVYYFSNKGDKTYPVPKYNSVLTDMSTEEGISNISYRNARKSFLVAGMLVDKRHIDETNEQENQTERAMLDFQGDAEACKIMYVQVDSEDEVPTFIPFTGNNFDKDFEVTRNSVKDNIGRVFNQPPILRAEDVGGNFGADLMNNAYNYYNSVTVKERNSVEKAFSEIFSRWHGHTFHDFSIKPLSYTTSINKMEK